MNKIKTNISQIFSQKLLFWYDNNRRNLPWRAQPGEVSNPYFVYLSEIMLQQTVVKTVIPYFLRFIKKWPSIQNLANADFDEISLYWAGLGYYRRAKNLHETANLISKNFEGKIPSSKKLLLTLPGIGEYTASAIIAIAFNKRSNVVDGNVERIFSRLFKIEKPIKDTKKEIFNYSEKYLPEKRYGDYAQALMDLGSLICTPKSPRCTLCPIIDFCRVGGTVNAKLYPKKQIKNKKPERFGLFYCLLNENGDILITINKNQGLLANMNVLPSVGWYEEKKFTKNLLFIPKEESLFNLEWKIIEKKLIHIFTHFKLNISIAVARIDQSLLLGDESDINRYKFVKTKDLNSIALPSLIKKIIKHLQDENIIHN
jgi:A/G-specific adenine glycosylase